MEKKTVADSHPQPLTKEEQKQAFKEAIKELFLEQYREFGALTVTFILRAMLIAVFAGSAYLWIISQGWHK